MTIGSAASLPGPAPEVPLPTFRSFRRPGRLSLVPGPQTADAPQRHLPVTALADDPPRGRILVVEDQASVALDVQRVLREAGFRAIGPAASVEEADRLTRQGRLDGAVVDLQLAGGAAADVAERLADRGIPFVWLSDAPFDVRPHPRPEAPAVGKPVRGEELIAALERAMTADERAGRKSWYPVPPPQTVWPRVFPQL